MWLPRPLYESLPYLYAALGVLLLAVPFLVEVPWRSACLATGALALGGGLVLWMHRREYRAAQDEYDPRGLDD